jgi:ethanolamine-phosphate cytidylyltransferase
MTDSKQFCINTDFTYVYIDGVWDLFHPSHLKFIERVREHATKELYPSTIKIIAGVISDIDAKSYKHLPIMNESQRARMIESCSLVDFVVRNSPLIISEEFLSTYNITFIYHGDDSSQSEFFKVPIEKNMMRYVKYDDEVSTTKIISKIKNYLD